MKLYLLIKYSKWVRKFSFRIQCTKVDLNKSADLVTVPIFSYNGKRSRHFSIGDIEG